MDAACPVRLTPPRTGARAARLLVALALTMAAAGRATARGQSVLDRPPDMGGTWVGAPATLYFNFLHRFEVTPAPARKVINYPTFLLGAGLPGHVLLGAHYATNSLLVSGFPNEWEFFARAEPLAQERGAPFDVAATGAYNQPARSWDGEIALARNVGPVRLLAAGRGFSSFRRTGKTRWAVAGGATLRLNRFVALAGDVATLTQRTADENVAWGAGLQLQIPYTPHSLSLQVSNTNTETLEGASIGAGGRHHWGFEFTIPLALSRFTGGGPVRGAASAQAAGDAAAEVTMSNRLQFSPAAVHIKVGQTIRWTNRSDLVHTVTLDPALAQKKGDAALPDGAAPFNSGDLKPGQSFAHTFTVPGEYRYFCIPHELAGMVARVVVEP